MLGMAALLTAWRSWARVLVVPRSLGDELETSTGIAVGVSSGMRQRMRCWAVLAWLGRESCRRWRLWRRWRARGALACPARVRRIALGISCRRCE